MLTLRSTDAGCLNSNPLEVYSTEMGNENYNTLISKLDAFIRKYYKNQLLKGLLYGVGIVLGFFLLTNVFEYFGEFETSGRTMLFWMFVIGSAYTLFRFILTPLFKLGNLGKIISHEQAAEIVGSHFTDVKDKLLNTLQLKQMSSNGSPDQFALVNASINQRIGELTPVPFTSAIDLSENKKHLWWLLTPIAILIGVLVFNSDIITSSTDRLINHGVHFEKKAPFHFIVNEENMEVVEKEDFVLEVKLEGEYVPNRVYVEVDGKRIKLEKENNVSFTHTFRNVQSDVEMIFHGDEFSSKPYLLKTIPNPTILNFDVELNYPSYTNKQNQTFKNTGDLIVPEGTQVNWVFKTQNTNQISFRLSDSMIDLKETIAGQFELSKKVAASTNYSVKSSNEFISNKDSINYFLNVIKDEYPSITMEEREDSSNLKIRYFTGGIKDDYGFSSLQFVYNISNKETGEKKKSKSTRIQINKNYNQDQFYHYWDVSDLDLDPGDQISYHFVVYDNDGVNGAKSARTRTRVFSAPTKKELSENTDKANEKIKEDLDAAKKEAQEIKDELKKVRKELIDKKNLSWQDKNKIEKLLDRQKNMENKVDQIKQQNEKNNQQQQDYKELSKEVLEKQKMLEEMFDELMDDEMKELYKELEELMKQLDKDKVQEKMEEMEWKQEDLEKELDRSLELFKQFEFEQKTEDIADKLEDLAKKQEELAEETKNKEKSPEELKEEQEKLDEEFEDIKEDMEKLDEMNEDLEKKHDLDEAKEDMEDIEKEMDESKDELDQKKEKKASESQKSAAEQMKESAAKLKSMMSQQQSEQQQEDMNALRMLLENLITFSFDQEQVMTELKTINTKDPRYVELGREQRKLKDDAKIIEDSLVALSKRVIEISNIVNKELFEMKRGIRSSIDFIKERQTPQARERQQYTMTSANNLALLLDEVLQQMQMQMASKMPGSGNCEKPGGSGSKPGKGKPSAQSMGNMRKQLQKQLDKMKKSLEKGPNPGGEKPGTKPGDKPGGTMPGGKGGMGGFPGSSEELAKLAAQQAAIRKEIQKMSQQLNEDGSGAGNGLKKIAKDMEKMEEDLVNRKFNSETLSRQQDIISKLLEHEKAQREQEFDNKRESNESKSQEKSNPKEFLEYKRRKEKEIELLKTVPADLKQYYKNKVNEYFNKVE